MTAMTTYGASQVVAVTTTSNAAYSDGASRTFLASEQTANATYAVFWGAGLSTTSATIFYNLRVVEGLTTRAEFVGDTKSTAPADRDQQGGFFFFTAAATPADVTFAVQVKNASGSPTLTLHNSHLRIVKLPTNSVWAETLSSQNMNTSTPADITGTSLSVSGEYLFLASVETSNPTITNNSTGLVVAIDGVNADPTYGGYSNLSAVTALMTAHKATAVSTAVLRFRQQITSTANPAYVRNIRFLALKASDFRDLFFSKLATDSSGTETTYTTALSLTDTVAAGDHLLLSGFIGHPVVNNTSSAYVQLTSGGVQVDEYIREPNNSTTPRGTPGGQIHRLETYSAGSRTWTLDRQAEAANTASVIAGSWIAVLDLNDGVSGGGMRGIKVYVGGAWVEKPVKVYVGGAWVQKPVKRYSGGSWS